MSKHLTNPNQYARQARPSDKEIRRRWKAGLCDARGNPLPKQPKRFGVMRTYSDATIDPGVLRDIQTAQARTRAHEAAARMEWSPFSRDLFNRS